MEKTVIGGQWSGKDRGQGSGVRIAGCPGEMRYAVIDINFTG